MLLVAAMMVVMTLPGTAWASHSSTEPSVAMFTAIALGSVIGTTILLALGLQIAYALRIIGGEKRVFLARQLRVGFGATFLLAAVTPYVALNFSMATVIPFVAGAGLVITAWVWGASRNAKLEPDMRPPSEA